MNVNTYEKVNGLKITGLQVYAGFQCGEFSGLYYKERNKLLKTVKTLKGTELKEVNNGWRYSNFYRGESTWFDFLKNMIAYEQEIGEKEATKQAEKFMKKANSLGIDHKEYWEAI